MIEIEGLRKVFQTRAPGAPWWSRALGRGESRTVVALDSLSFSVEAGTFYSLLGANGAGKTTSMKILCTLLLPDGGHAQIAGFNVVEHPRRVREHLGVSIRGERSVYWKLTGRQNLEYFGRLSGFRGADLRQRIGEVVEIIGLGARIDDYVERYSMGMKQRLAIGCAVVHRPPVLLLDEPTIGLDPHGARALRHFIKDELCREHGVTVLYTTHYMHEAEELSDRVGVLHGGRMVAEGHPDEVRASVAHKEAVELQLRGLPEAGLAALRGHVAVSSITASVGANDVATLHVVPAFGEVPVGDLVEAARQAGARLLSVQVARPSLEDAFVALTGTSVSDTGEAVAIGGHSTGQDDDGV
jgi:ABC-2 type transport system ATP-binding protein